MDPRLAAELSGHRLNGQAVGRAAAVAAALADPLVNERPLRGHRRLAAPPLAPLLRRALLVVDEHGDAVDRGQFPLHVDQVVAVPDVGAVS